jgi:predicted branched-subunit amino acid permease
MSILLWVFGGFEMFKLGIVFCGFFISIVIKEVNSKNEYLFYFNNGISKMNLLVFSFIMNFVFAGIFIAFINLTVQ